jgi:hypothetical protein
MLTGHLHVMNSLPLSSFPPKGLMRPAVVGVTHVAGGGLLPNIDEVEVGTTWSLDVRRSGTTNDVDLHDSFHEGINTFVK